MAPHKTTVYLLEELKARLVRAAEARRRIGVLLLQTPGDDWSQIALNTDLSQSREASAGAASVLTFLIADVRGYTQFTVDHGDQAAAELAMRFAEAARRVVSGRGGRVVELRGDEALAVFSSTRQALWAATELSAHFGQELGEGATPPVRIGIGLDAGEAVPVESGYRGAALNLAARLCSLAGPGEVLASETVTNLARKVDGLTYLDRGAARLKGFADPVHVLLIRPADEDGTEAESRERTMARRAAAAADGEAASAGGETQILPIGGFLGSLPESALVARDAELGEILAAVDAAARGQGQTVLLAGEPGAGKTRLAQEATLKLRNRGFLIAAGRCYEAEASVPYYAFLEALSVAYGAAPATIRREAARRWPYLGILLPNQVGVQEVNAGGHEEQHLAFAVASFLEAIAELVPVALLMDDLHWADPATLKLMLHVARHTRSSRVFILGAYRDVEINRRHPLERTLRDLDREGLMRRIAVRRLDQQGTAALMAASFGEEEISAEFAGLVHGRTEGNPFFVQQVVRALVERGDVYREDGRWERKAVEAIDVPESVRSVIGQRLERLSEGTQEVLFEASVLGQAFNVDDLVALGERASEKSEADIEEALDEAEGAGLVREVRRDVYGFDHALTQQALYGELSTRRRRRLHLAAGEAIEALPERQRRTRTAELSRHFLEGDDPPRAGAYTVAAAEEAESVLAHEEAEALFRTALELARDLGEVALEARALLGFGSLLRGVGRYTEALETLTPATALCRQLEDPEAEMRAEAEIGRVYLSLGDAETGIPRLSSALAAARERGEPSSGSRALAAATSTLARLHWIRGDNDAALEAATRAADLARAAGDRRVEAEAETRRGTILQMVDPEEGLSVLDNAIEIAEEVGALDVVMTAANNAMVNFWMRGDWSRAEPYQRRAIAAGERAGDPATLAFMHRGLASILAGRGNWREAREHAERGVQLSDAVGDSWGRPAILSVLAHLDILEGRWVEATALLEEARELARRHDDVPTMSVIFWAEAWLDLLNGRPQAVIDIGAPLVDNPRIDLIYRLSVHDLVVRATTDVGDPARAEEQARQVLEGCQQTGYLYQECATRTTLGSALARQGRTAEAQVEFEKAIELGRPMPHPLNEGIARYEWGRMLADAFDATGARQQLEEALTLFRNLGARPFIERTEDALAELQPTEETRST